MGETHLNMSSAFNPLSIWKIKKERLEKKKEIEKLVFCAEKRL